MRIEKIAVPGQASGEIGSVAASTSSPFDDPIPVRKGKPLLTLKDAADYITKLPETEQHHPAWQAAVEALILVAETNAPTVFARIGMLQAINRHKPVEFDPKTQKPAGGSANWRGTERAT